MTRTAANKIINALRVSYPQTYKDFTRDMFVLMCDRLENAYKRFPDNAVMKFYDEWIANSRYAPTISDILPSLFREFPSKVTSSDPSKWEHYEDEKGYEFVIPPDEVRERLRL